MQRYFSWTALPPLPQVLLMMTQMTILQARALD
jgi:hypothetical protein